MDYFCWIGGAVFSAGAGGNPAGAPSFCARAWGWAGSGAGVVGRSPPGFDSAGALFGVEGDDCSGCVACAICVSPALSWAIETMDTPTPAAGRPEAHSISPV